MKKIFLLIIFILTLVGCDNNVYYWKFNYQYEEVNKICIIETISEFKYHVVQEIDLTLSEEIYNDVMSIEMKRYGPNLYSPSGKCILIVFNNGEYDIISQIESKHYKYKGENIFAYNSWLYCDENEFNELINKYLNK